MLGDAVPLLAGLDAGLLDGVGLEKAFELPLVTPTTAKIVVAERPVCGVADERIGQPGNSTASPAALPLKSSNVR